MRKIFRHYNPKTFLKHIKSKIILTSQICANSEGKIPIGRTNPMDTYSFPQNLDWCKKWGLKQSIQTSKGK